MIHSAMQRCIAGVLSQWTAAAESPCQTHQKTCWRGSARQAWLGCANRKQLMHAAPPCGLSRACSPSGCGHGPRSGAAGAFALACSGAYWLAQVWRTPQRCGTILWHVKGLLTLRCNEFTPYFSVAPAQQDIKVSRSAALW